MDPVEKSQREVHLFLLALRLQSRGLHSGTQVRQARQGRVCKPISNPPLGRSAGQARRVVTSGQRLLTWRGTAVRQLQVLGKRPLLAEAFPWGHCVTVQDMLPAHPALCSPPRHCHPAAPQSNRTGGAAPSQNSLALLLPPGPRRVRFHPFL